MDPVEITLEEYITDKPADWNGTAIWNEVRVKERNQPVALWVPDGVDTPDPGTVKGWWNRTRKDNTEYFKLAGGTGGSQSRSNGAGGQEELSPGRTRSIERQACAKSSGPTFAALTAEPEWRKTFAQDVRFIVDAVHDAVKGE